MKDRIRQIMEAQGMTQYNFAQWLGTSASTLSNIFNGRTNPSMDIVEAIKKRLPQLSTDWLIFGSGDMYNEMADVSSQNVEVSQQRLDPLFDFSSDEVKPNLFSSTISSSSVRESSAAPHTVALEPSSPVQQVIVEKLIERPQRKVTEIRVFYDDQTWESFYPNLGKS